MTRTVGRALALALMAGVLMVGPAPSSAGGGSRDPVDRATELQRQIGEASQAEADALGELDAIRARRAELDSTVGALEAQTAEARARLDAAEAELERVQGILTVLESQLNATTLKLIAAQEKTDAAAADLYVRAAGGGSSDLDVALEATDPREVLAARRYIGDVRDKQRAVIDERAEVIEDLEIKQGNLEKEKAHAEEIQAQVEEEHGAVLALLDEQRAARNDASAQEEAEAALVGDIQSQREQFEAELDELYRTSEEVRELLSGSSGAPLGTGQFLRPVPGAIVSGFGPRVHPILGTTRVHTGLDMAAAYGEPIRAADTGVVVMAGWNGGYGNCVIIDHGAGLATLYAHQSELAVTVGQRVTRGEVIGYVGSTGLSTGPHLHFEVRVNGTPVDPTQYL
ncbi:MAG: murein hydrolase activator EnvC family protein [Acidimicrobiia bacterium]